MLVDLTADFGGNYVVFGCKNYFSVVIASLRSIATADNDLPIDVDLGAQAVRRRDSIVAAH